MSKLSPTESLNREGVDLAKAGQFEKAVEKFRAALELDATNEDVLRNLAHAYWDLNWLEEGEGVYLRLIEIDPNSGDIWHRLGRIRKAMKRHEESREAFAKAAELDPSEPRYHSDLGLALSELKRHKEAKAAFLRAIELDAAFTDAYINMGVMCQDAGKPEEAIKYLTEAVRLRPASVSAQNNLGVSLSDARRFQESITHFNRALAIDPEYVIAWNNLGNSLRSIGRNKEALVVLERAVKLKPDYAEAYNNLALVHVQLGMFEKSIGYFNKSLLLRPDYPECHVNRGMKRLLLGDFERGWADYEWRWQTKQMKGRKLRGRKWDGSSLAGKRLLLCSEQGLGDTFQFIRYAAEMKLRGATVIFEGQAAARHVLARTPGIDEYISRDEKLPQYDFYAPVLSLPGLLETSLDNIPAPIPYIFTDPDIGARWKPRVQALGKVRVGIVWQGNPRYGSDNRRSARLEHFQLLGKIEHVALVSLQRGFGSEQIQSLNGAFELTTFAGIDEQTDGFIRTSAIIKNLDLVVTVDTAVAHLAGAMGITVWLLIPFANDWRWLWEREDTPWYPTMRLFRQKTPGDWPEVFDRVEKALADYVREHVGVKQSTDPDTREKYQRLMQDASRAIEQNDAAIAQGYLERAIELAPTEWQPHHDVAVLLAKRGNLSSAISLFRRAIQLSPGSPCCFSNIGLAFLQNGQYLEAASHLQTAIRLGGGSPSVYNNLGLAQGHLSDFVDAESSYISAMRLQPDYADAHFNLAKVLLTQEKFDQGWLEYEWRGKVGSQAQRQILSRRWFGESLDGKTIFLHAEKSVGETLLLLRFANHLSKKGAKVVLECQPVLKGVLSQCKFLDKLISSGNPVPPHDLNLALPSLPGVLGIAGKEEEMSGPPYIVPDPSHAARWKLQFDKVDGLKIAVAWPRNTQQQGTRAYSTFARRLQTLKETAGVSFVDLFQRSSKPFGNEGNRHAKSIESVPRSDEIDDLSRFAAIMANVELVITADLTIAHLAGAIGVETWTIVPSSSDWWWHADREDSPWYSMMRLWRQRRFEKTSELLERLGEALEQRIAAAQSGHTSYQRQDDSESRSLHTQALSQLRSGREGEAINQLEHLLATNPRFVDAHLDLGVIHARNGKLDEAISYFQRAIAVQPDMLAAQMNLASALLDKKDFEGAEAHLRNISPQFPDAYDLHFRYGRSLCGLGRHPEGITAFKNAASIRAASPEPWLASGDAFTKCSRWSDAIDSYQAALQRKPNLLDAMKGMATALEALGRDAEAIEIWTSITDSHPEDAEAHKLRGILLLRQGSSEAALASLQQAVYLRPQNATDHLNLAKALFKADCYEQAWLELEWRFRIGRRSDRRFGGKKWTGELLEGRSILFVAERDTADTLQFLRYAKLASEQNARVVLACGPNLMQLFYACPYLDEIVSLEENMPACDFYCYLMSAPIGFRTTKQTIPKLEAYLPSITKLKQEFSVRLQHLTGVRLGFACVGPRAHEWHAALVKASLFAHTEWSVIDLMDGKAPIFADDSAATASTGASRMATLGALISNLDLVLTNDRSLAHLAGATGCSVLAWYPLTQSPLFIRPDSNTLWYRDFAEIEAGLDFDDVAATLVARTHEWSLGRKERVIINQEDEVRGDSNDGCSPNLDIKANVKTNKLAVVTLVTTSEFERLAETTLQTQRHYANRVNADMVVLKKRLYPHPHYDKWQLYDLLTDYDRTLFLDADIIVRPDCPDLFAMVPSDHVAGENELLSFPAQEKYLNDFLEAAGMHWLPCPFYLNGGVILASRIHRDIFRPPEVVLEQIPWPEQSHLNARLIGEGVPVHFLPPEFNDRHRRAQYLRKSYLLHYSVIPVEEKIKRAKRDLSRWTAMFRR
jgi:tetratricopeptide (TPR) repeat protein